MLFKCGMAIRKRIVQRARCKTSGYQFKPTRIPNGFVLVIDTREQKPLFQNVKDLSIEYDKLDTGDYAIRGYEHLACVERKQLSDFDAFLGRDRETTMKKLERMNSMLWSGLVIETSHNELFGEREYGQITPEHARGFLKMVDVRYMRITTYYTKEVDVLERWILDRLAYVYCEIIGGKYEREETNNS